jgi:hypothetical protein
MHAELSWLMCCSSWRKKRRWCLPPLYGMMLGCPYARSQVLQQQKEKVESVLPGKQQQALHSRVKVETMRDSLWEAEEAAIQAKAKLDEIDAAVRALGVFLFRAVLIHTACRYSSSKTCCRFQAFIDSMLKRAKST